MEKKDLKITTYKEKEGYVFISYSSNDSDEVFNDYVLPLQEKYGLRVFCDIDFQNRATQNWTTQMRENLEEAQVCIIFISDSYVSSYACLLEVLVATCKKIPIIKVMLKKPTVSDDDNERKISSSTVGQFKRIGQQLELRHLNEALLCYLDIKEYIESEKISKRHISKAFIDYLAEIKGNYLQNSNGLLAIKNSIEEVQNKESFCKITKVEQIESVEEKVQVTKSNKEMVDTSEMIECNENPSVDDSTDETPKKKYSVTGDINYVLYGEERIGNQSDIMIMTFGKVLKKYPEYIDSAIEAFTCLSSVDYSDKKNCDTDMPSYFRVCYTFEIQGKTVCVGTAYGMADKLKLIAKLLMLVGEERDVLKMEGIELPIVKQRKTNISSDEYNGAINAGEVYYVLGNKKEGNQSNMMWDVFEALAENYPDKIDKLTTITSVKLAKDVQNANTKTADPVYFRGCKSFDVNGEEYLVGTSYGRADKIKQICKMINLCGAPDDFFAIEGEEIDEKPTIRSKKQYDI